MDGKYTNKQMNRFSGSINFTFEHILVKSGRGVERYRREREREGKKWEGGILAFKSGTVEEDQKGENGKLEKVIPFVSTNPPDRQKIASYGPSQ